MFFYRFLLVFASLFILAASNLEKLKRRKFWKVKTQMLDDETLRLKSMEIFNSINIEYSPENLNKLLIRNIEMDLMLSEVICASKFAWPAAKTVTGYISLHPIEKTLERNDEILGKLCKPNELKSQ